MVEESSCATAQGVAIEPRETAAAVCELPQRPLGLTGPADEAEAEAARGNSRSTEPGGSTSRPNPQLAGQNRAYVRGNDGRQKIAGATGYQLFPSLWFSTNHISPEPSAIDRSLFLGGMVSVCDKEHLLSLNVSSIVTVAAGLGPPRFPDTFTYTVVEVDDAAHVDLMQFFALCFEAINKGRDRGGTVVHCMAGVSRSVTIVVAYLMKHNHMPLRKALAWVRKCRPQANPNIGFMRQLERYDGILAPDRRKNKCVMPKT